MAPNLVVGACDTTTNTITKATTVSDLDILDLSPDLVKIRPIYLEATHIKQLAPRWRTCSCCYEPLQKPAIQLACCDTIFHRSCLQDFAKQKASGFDEYGDLPNRIFCPWCNVTLQCRPADMWAFLDEDAVDSVISVGKELDKWLTELSKLDSIARAKFMTLVMDFDEISGELVRAVKLPAKVTAVRRLCQSSPEALKAFDLMYKERQSSFNALLEWKDWLTYVEDLENIKDLVNADTMYGHGPNRFAPRIVERLGEEG